MFAEQIPKLRRNNHAGWNKRSSANAGTETARSLVRPTSFSPGESGVQGYFAAETGYDVMAVAIST